MAGRAFAKSALGMPGSRKGNYNAAAGLPAVADSYWSSSVQDQPDFGCADLASVQASSDFFTSRVGRHKVD